VIITAGKSFSKRSCWRRHYW